MKTERTNNGAVAEYADKLESFGICRLACQLFKDFGNDSEISGKNHRGGESTVPRNLIMSPVTSHLSPLI